MTCFHPRFLTMLSILITLTMTTATIAVSGGNGSLALLATPQERTLVNRAWAVVYAPEMRRGSLLMLRGAIGRARTTFRESGQAWCPPVPLRLLLGDFSGDSVEIGRSGPALALVMNRDIADAMRAGNDITSDGLAIGSLDQALSAKGAGFDIVLAGSASPENGFVMNMGSNLWNDLFGASGVSGPCTFEDAGSALRSIR